MNKIFTKEVKIALVAITALVLLFFGMMPYAWAVNKIVPRRSKLKQAAGRKLASLPAGQRIGGEPVKF
jgi:hypothetical protein